jgi:hypothetical protein
MLQMASHPSLRDEEIKDIHVAFNICAEEAENTGAAGFLLTSRRIQRFQ